LSQPWAPFLSDISVFANAILPKNFGGESESAFFANPVGTGPFVLKSFVKGGNAVLAKNKNYWQPGKPYLDGSTSATSPTTTNGAPAQVRGGPGDLGCPACPGDCLKANPAWCWRHSDPGPSICCFFNEKVPQFKDRHVRRAINHAINIEQLAKVTTFGTADPGNSFFPPSLQYYAKVPTLGYNLAQAKAELAQSAYPHGFSTSILVPSGNTQYVEAATIIQQELKPLNINVSIRQLDDAAYTAAFEAFNYEAMINGATNDISDPDEMASFQVDVQDGGSHSF